MYYKLTHANTSAGNSACAGSEIVAALAFLKNNFIPRSSAIYNHRLTKSCLLLTLLTSKNSFMQKPFISRLLMALPVFGMAALSFAACESSSSTETTTTDTATQVSAAPADTTKPADTTAAAPGDTMLEGNTRPVVPGKPATSAQ
jgi:hypothetical protein